MVQAAEICQTYFNLPPTRLRFLAAITELPVVYLAMRCLPLIAWSYFCVAYCSRLTSLQMLAFHSNPPTAVRLMTRAYLRRYYYLPGRLPALLPSR